MATELKDVTPCGLIGHDRFSSPLERAAVFTPHSPTGLKAKQP